MARGAYFLLRVSLYDNVAKIGQSKLLRVFPKLLMVFIECLRGAIADYIVDELVINKVTKKQPDEQFKRAYAYYHQLINAERNRDFDSNDK